MKWFRHIVTTTLLVGYLAGASSGIQRVRPPQFDSEYELPTTTAPQPQQTIQEYVDLIVLLGALGLASYLVLKKRSRPGLLALTVFSLLYFGFWRGGCVCPIGAIQNVAMALADPSYAIPLVVLGFFLLPLLFTLLVGRVFCAAVCPLGAVQDLLALRPVKLPSWMDQGLGLLAYAYLGAAVLFAATGSAFIICRYDPFVALFRLLPIGKWTQSLVRGDVPGGAFGISGRVDLLVLTGAFLLISVFVGRAYCRFLCPYGALLRWLSPLSRWSVTITPTECNQCRLCEDSCPFGAIRAPTGDWGRGGRERDKKRLALLLVLLPALIVLGTVLGWTLSPRLSRMHYKVRLAERIWLEETNQVQGTTDASEAFRGTRRAESELYKEASSVQDTFAIEASVFGGFVGLVIGIKLIRLSVRRRRTDYEPDRSACLSCGRCFAYCPVEQDRRKKLKAAKFQTGS